MTGPARIDVGGHALHVDTGGRGGRHFLCLHGLVDTSSVWERLAPELEARGRVCRVDQRGHGASDAPPGPYRRADLARDVVRVLDACGVERSILVGHSMGGVVAMETALAHPERVAGLVLLGTTSECREKVAAWYERVAQAGEREGTEGLRREIYGRGSTKWIEGDARGIAHATRMLKSLCEDPLTPKLGRLACPVLALVGTDDPMGARASEIVCDAAPDGRARLVRVPDRGHWLHLDAPETVVAALDDWLAHFDC